MFDQLIAHHDYPDKNLLLNLIEIVCCHLVKINDRSLHKTNNCLEMNIYDDLSNTSFTIKYQLSACSVKDNAMMKP